MCGIDEIQGGTRGQGIRKPAVVAIDGLLHAARFLLGEEEARRSAVGFIGYGQTRPGDKVLLAVNSHHDRAVVDAMIAAFRERQARVDLLVTDIGPDRPFDELDEVRVVMRRGPLDAEPRRWDYIGWLERVAEQQKYDLVVHGLGGPIPRTPFRYEAFPWLKEEQFSSAANTFPRHVHTLINRKVWRMFWEEGRNARVHLTDPEGSDVTWTLWEEYFDDRPGFSATPAYGHLMAHPAPPMSPRADARGVVVGTTCHFSRPFPQLTLELDGGRVVGIRGGGRYGDAWRELEEESAATKYPCFPRPGLFWLWEAAIGTNPKITRPAGIHLLSSGGCEWERRRSGIVHMGFGTLWRSETEHWAAAQGVLYGHLHSHMLFPTLTLTTSAGREHRIIDRGRLTVLDDPEVRDAAAAYGAPDVVLAEDWQPEIPGISAPGSYSEYARDPARWIYGQA